MKKTNQENFNKIVSRFKNDLDWLDENNIIHIATQLYAKKKDGKIIYDPDYPDRLKKDFNPKFKRCGKK